jgi:ubiquinone/menaquinone biosynthesis C-methylase UbiE
MRNPIDPICLKKKHVCPWWLCFTFDNPLRKLIHDPNKILAPYISPGSTAIDIGAGMGYFTLPLCRLVGKSGRVMAVDIQARMLRALEKRAAKAGGIPQLTTHLGTPEGIGVRDKADFVLTFWMMHEAPNREDLFREIHAVLKEGGICLLAEPKIHVNAGAFALEVEAAQATGLIIKDRPQIALSRSVLLTRPGRN